MILVIQRVSEASIRVDQKIVGKIGPGLLVLQGIGPNDTQDDIDWLVKKTTNLRIFSDDLGLMNLSVMDINGEILAISQFTLLASTKKGNRPSFINAAKPDVAEPLYNSFIKSLKEASNLNVETGIFGADMKVQLTNDGPVTIMIDSKNRT